ncbi:helix-turn-helix transcriptional regulator [Streptomyces sp. NPDC006872]|uniref:helix-turn-helix domain-containing protein n=1 Tax=Streptomyces sp. NPDC006872 TaxID=3155720 RepID=UPI003402A567
MGRRDKPVDHSRPARGRLAEHLRHWRETAGITYETLARRTGLSPATLKRAASGAVVPQRATAEAYVEGCGGGQDAVRAAHALWRQARIEERGRLAHAPRPELIADAADLSRALEAVWERAGAPSLRQIRDRSGNPLSLPLSSAARIVKRDTVPADEQQLRAFLTGCGVPPEQHAVWTTAFGKITSPAAAVQMSVNDLVAVSRRIATRRLLRLTARREQAREREPQWKQFMDLLPPVAVEEIIVSGTQSYLASEAARNGTTVQKFTPDFFVEHNGTYTVFETKSASGPGRGPQAGGAVKASPSPPGDDGSPAARREPRRGSGLPAPQAPSRSLAGWTPRTTAVPSPHVPQAPGSQEEACPLCRGRISDRRSAA